MKFTKKHVTTSLLVIIIGLVIIFSLYLVLPLFYHSGNAENNLLTIDKEHPDITYEGFTRTKYNKDGDKEFFINASKLKGFLGEKVFILEDLKEVTFWQDDGSTITASAKEGIYEEQTGNVNLTGNVHILITQADPASQPISFLSNDLKYNNETGMIESEGPVKLVRDKAIIAGIGLTINRDDEYVILKQEVTTSFPFQDDKSEQTIPITISSESARYYHEAEHVHYVGSVHTVSGLNNIRSDELSLFLAQDQRRIECIGNVDAQLHGIATPNKSGSDNLTSISLQAGELIIYQLTRLVRARDNVRVKSDQRMLDADMVELFYSENDRHIVALNAEGNVKIDDGEKAFSGGKVHYSLESDRLIATESPEFRTVTDFVRGDLMILMPDAGLMTVRGNVHGSIQPEASKKRDQAKGKAEPFSDSDSGPIEFSSERGYFDQHDGTGLLEGSVRIRQSVNTLYAEKLLFLLTGSRKIESFEAFGNVRMNDAEQNLRCQSLNYSGQDRLAIATGNCKLWRGLSTVEAPQIFVYTEQEKLQAIDGVRTHIEGSILKSKGDISAQSADLTLFNKNPVDITSETLWYYNKTSEALFSGDVVIVRTGTDNKRGKLSADSVRITITNHVQGLYDLEANGNVVITHKMTGGERIVKGDKAGYQSSRDVLWVEGRKVIITDPMNSVTCTRAEFFLTERRYVIEGHDAKSIHYPLGKEQGSETDTKAGGQQNQTEQDKFRDLGKPANPDQGKPKPGGKIITR